MPVVLRCDGDDCGSETIYNPSSLQGTDWTREPMIGGTRVLCPKCKAKKEDNKFDIFKMAARGKYPEQIKKT